MLYFYEKIISATIFHEHFLRLDAIVAHIRWLRENTCLDMNDFNFMVGFASPDAPRRSHPPFPGRSTPPFRWRRSARPAAGSTCARPVAPLVKHAHQTGRSYTCALQQLLYRRDHAAYEPPENALYQYLLRMRPDIAQEYWQRPAKGPLGMPPLHAIIEADPSLKQVYDPGAFVLDCDGYELPLESQILKRERHILTITKESRLTLYMRRDVLATLSKWPAYNSLYVMLLDGRTIVYGDEGRTK